MKKIITINVAKDFGRFPAGRYLTDGKFSGEAFRQMIEERLHNADQVIIDLSGTEGYGSSFLEEAFGGLVRNRKFSTDDIRNRLKIFSSDPDFEFFVEEAEDYLESALKEIR
jgi:hypothetical protein